MFTCNKLSGSTKSLDNFRYIIILSKKLILFIFLFCMITIFPTSASTYYMLKRYNTPSTKFLIKMPDEWFTTLTIAMKYRKTKSSNEDIRNIENNAKLSAVKLVNADTFLQKDIKNIFQNKIDDVNHDQYFLYNDKIRYPIKKENSPGLQDQFSDNNENLYEKNAQLLKPKRSAANMKSLPELEHVCDMMIKNDYQPKYGHEKNGTRVLIQQDDRRQFRATFIECESTKRDQCYGIDNMLFTSECVTVYEYRSAGVKLENSSSDFVEGYIKVPITCQCRLRRKMNRILID